MNDGDLHRAVLQALASDPMLADQEIGIAVRDGVVVLSGYLDANGHARAAERLVARVPGVTAVVQTARVWSEDQRFRSDTAIAYRVADRLLARPGCPKRGPLARVERGWVTLEGEVDLVHERSAAEEGIRHIPGVRGVSNRLTVRPPETVHRIQAKIDAALSRVVRPVMAALPTTDFGDPRSPVGVRTLDSDAEAASNAVAPER